MLFRSLRRIGYVRTMLTRLEIDGFRNLRSLVVDLGPLTVVTGPNGIGKSDVLDAIGLLASLADAPFDALDPAVFGRDELRLAAEMIVPGRCRDDFGREAEATTTFLRYELTLGLQGNRVVLRHESLDHITQGDAARRLRWPHRASTFRRTAVTGRRSGEPFVSTAEGRVRIHQDAGSSGILGDVDAAPRTVLSTATTARDPTLLAARREMASWRVGLPTFPASDAARERLRTVLALPAVAPGRLGAAAARVLALCTLAEDPRPGLWCVEEPENGVHPSRLSALADLLRSLVVDARVAPGPENPLRQLIVVTQSPGLVQLQEPADLLLADLGPQGLQLLPVTRTWRTRDGDLGVSRAVLLRAAASPPTGQLPLV